MRNRAVPLLAVCVVLPIAMSTLAGEPNAGCDRMPRLRGDSFVADVSAPNRDAIAILNLTQDQVTLFVYHPSDSSLDVLYSVPAEVTRVGDVWHVNVPERGGSFDIARDRNAVTLNGAPTRLQPAPPGGVTDVQISGLRPNPNRQRQGARIEAREGGAVPLISPTDCVFAAYYQGCCSSCYCVHEMLDIRFMDFLCCGFGC